MVSAVGDPDLSSGEPAAPSLAAAIRAGDPAAIAAFRGTRLARVRAYAGEASRHEQLEELAEAAFADFLIRVQSAEPADERLDHVLLEATRAAAAGRFFVQAPPGHVQSPGAECYATPELLAALANGDSRRDGVPIGRHLARCPVCRSTLERMQRAERAFARATADLPALEVRETTVELPPAIAEPAPRKKPSIRPQRKLHRDSADSISKAKAEPKAEPPPPPGAQPLGAGPAPIAVRRRSGGLVGLIRRRLGAQPPNDR